MTKPSRLDRVAALIRESQEAREKLHAAFDVAEAEISRVRAMVAQRALAEMMHDDARAASSPQVRAQVRDEHGRRIMTMSLTIVVEDVN